MRHLSTPTLPEFADVVIIGKDDAASMNCEAEGRMKFKKSFAEDVIGKAI